MQGISGDSGGSVFDAATARARIELLEQSLSEVFHLLYGVLVLILTFTPPDIEMRIAQVMKAKILQMPQGCPIGRRLLELDREWGGMLERHGICLQKWLYEPREKPQ